MNNGGVFDIGAIIYGEIYGSRESSAG